LAERGGEPDDGADQGNDFECPQPSERGAPLGDQRHGDAHGWHAPKGNERYQQEREEDAEKQ
jgi:hypothetical protein